MTRRDDRLVAETECRKLLPHRLAHAFASRRTYRSAVGLKRWFIPGSEFEGTGVRTPYAARELRRRRRAGVIAKRARRRNRCR